MQSDSPTAVSIANAAHYQWGDGCDGWHLVRSEGLSVIQEQMPPGTREVRHRHERSRQYFHVLQGALSIEVDGARCELKTSEGLEIAPGQMHQVFNDSAGLTTFLVVSQPPSHGDRIV